MGTKHIELLRVVFGLFYEKIQPNRKFRNQRVKEWCDGLPSTPKSLVDSADESALDKIVSLHESLELIDHKNSSKGYGWPKLIQRQYERVLEELEQCINSSEVDYSVYNIFHVHNSVLLRSKGLYNEAIGELDKSTSLLKKKISEHDKYLPRYTREIYMNLGAQSELHRLEGDIDRAISISDDMYALTMEESENNNYKEEDERAQCLSTSWALYYCCAAHLSVEDWSGEKSRISREWYFSEVFSNEVYKDWIVPVLIRIVEDPVWSQRYPDYFNEITNILYTDTATNELSKAARRTSVFFGRVRLTPTAPITMFGLLGVMAINLANARQHNSGNYTDPAGEIIQVIDSLEQEGYEFETEAKESVKAALKAEIVSLEKNILTDEKDGSHAIADRGIGVGSPAGAHNLLAISPYFSDRGIGVA